MLKLCQAVSDEEAQKSQGVVRLSNPLLIIKHFCNDHNEEMGPGGGIFDLENPDNLKT